jgi:hypothetical protein
MEASVVFIKVVAASLFGLVSFFVVVVVTLGFLAPTSGIHKPAPRTKD